MTDSATTAGKSVDKALAEGVLESIEGETIVLRKPGTDYRVHLIAEGGVKAAVGKKIRGHIRCRARRIDAVGTGGRYIEPIYGRPRRVQGRVIDVDEGADALVVDTGPFPVILITDERQKATGFEVASTVSTDVLAGSTFSEV